MNNSKALLKRFLPLLLAALLLTASFFPYQEKKDRLYVVPGVWPASESLLVAGDLQLLPHNRFQLIEIPWASAVVRAFGSKAADVALVTLDNVVRMREAGQKLRVLSVLNQSRGADALVAPRSFQRVEDLKGKRVAVERSSGSYLLASALESVGLTLEDVEAVPMFQSEMELAMQGGQVEALVAKEPWLTKLTVDGRHRLYDSSQLKVPIMYLLVASERACISSRQELVFMLKVQAQVAETMHQGKPFPGMDAVLRRESMTAEQLASCLERLRMPSPAENAEILKNLPQLSDQVEEVMIRAGIIKTKAKPWEWIDDSIIKEVFH